MLRGACLARHDKNHLVSTTKSRSGCEKQEWGSATYHLCKDQVLSSEKKDDNSDWSWRTATVILVKLSSISLNSSIIS